MWWGIIIHLDPNGTHISLKWSTPRTEDDKTQSCMGLYSWFSFAYDFKTYVFVISSVMHIFASDMKLNDMYPVNCLLSLICLMLKVVILNL